MGERGQNLTLLEKAFALRIDGAEGEQFDRHALGYFAVRALSQIYRAHASATDDIQ